MANKNVWGFNPGLPDIIGMSKTDPPNFIFANVRNPAPPPQLLGLAVSCPHLSASQAACWAGQEQCWCRSVGFRKEVKALDHPS